MVTLNQTVNVVYNLLVSKGHTFQNIAGLILLLNQPYNPSNTKDPI